MGTVHGVYLKYVGLSALSYAGYSMLLSNEDDGSSFEFGGSGRSLQAVMATNDMKKIIPAIYLGYSTILNGVIAILFKLERGMTMIGKDPKRGTIPLWSYIIFAPFHLPTLLYTHIHTLHGLNKHKEDESKNVPVASKVQDGWYVGGCYGHYLNKEWTAIIDLTVEFPETCINNTKQYMLCCTWDGVPCTPDQLEQAANFAVNARKTHGGGDVLVHCAHGRGRSTTVMCACLVKAGLFKDWLDAFENGIKPYRPVCKLNRRMRQNLTEWQAKYVDNETMKAK